MNTKARERWQDRFRSRVRAMRDLLSRSAVDTTPTPVAAEDTAEFDLARHNDPIYKPPSPWTEWDDGCWVCRRCGSASGWRGHAPSCEFEPRFKY